MYDQEEKWPVPYTSHCKWCGADGFEWVINKKTGRWELQTEDGSKHVHQPPKEG